MNYAMINKLCGLLKKDGVDAIMVAPGADMMFLIGGSPMLCERFQALVIKNDGTMYYYLRNAQGDITGIVDTSGNVVTEYVYDAWGNVISTTGSKSTTVGKYSPFRYRGYIYDDSGLYYLKTRYYDPTMERFVCADGYASTGVGLLGTNSFAYCNNNPSTLKDSGGTRTVDCVRLTEEAHKKESIEATKKERQLQNEVSRKAQEEERDSVNILQAKSKPNMRPQKDKRKGSEDRQKTGDRERNVGHPNGEEHSRVPKGSGRRKYILIGVIAVTSIALAALVIDDVSIVGIADDVFIPPVAVLWWEAIEKLFA